MNPFYKHCNKFPELKQINCNTFQMKVVLIRAYEIMRCHHSTQRVQICATKRSTRFLGINERLQTFCDKFSMRINFLIISAIFVEREDVSGKIVRYSIQKKGINNFYEWGKAISIINAVACSAAYFTLQEQKNRSYRGEFWIIHIFQSYFYLFIYYFIYYLFI